ncbi:MAG: tetratricopeptide repeat protein, partial [Anaerolineales bacterium]
VHRDLGNSPDALSHAEQAINLGAEGTQTAEITAFRGLAAELASALIQDSKTRSYVDLENKETRQVYNQEDENIPRGSLWGDSIYKNMLEKDQFRYHCLRVELYLEDGEDILAADALTSAIKIKEDHPRVMALRSRLSIRHGDLDTADQVLKSAMQTLGVSFEIPIEVCENVEDLITLSDAMMDQLHWNGAVYLLGQTKNIKTQEPRSLIKYAHALVMRAETQRLYRKLHVKEHAPGESALAEDAYQSFENTISHLRSLVENDSESTNQTTQQSDLIQEKINTLYTRGKAVFEPSDQHCQALGDLNPSPVIRAAYIASLIQINDPDTAAQVAKNHLDSDDKSFHTYPPFLAQASIALANDYPAIALNAIRDAVRIVTRNSSPDQAIYYVLQADILMVTKDYPFALESIANAVSLWDDEPRWHAIIADLYISKSKLAEHADIHTAIRHLVRAADLEPDYAFHHISLGEAYLRDKNLYGANEALERAKQLASDQADVWLALAQAYWTARDDDRAILYAHRASDLAPDLLAARFLIAKIAIQTGNINKARQEAESALQLDPNNTEGHILLAQALLALDHPLQALNIIETAIQIAPDSVELLLERIHLLQQVHGAEFALDELDKIIDTHPTDDRIITLQAEILAECGHTEKALEKAREALNLLNTNGIIPKRIARVHKLLGSLQRQMGQLDQAVHHLNEAIDIYPEWTDPYLELGQTYQDRRQQDQALLLYKQAIEVSPRDPRPYYRSGLILKDAKDYLQAEAMLRRAADLAPNDLNVHRQLGAMVALNIVHNRNQETKVDNLG